MSRTNSLIIVTLVYIVSFFTATIILLIDLPIHPLLQMGLADLSATVLVFLASYIFKNSSVYDPYWSVFPLFAVMFWYIEYEGMGNEVRNCIVSGLVFLWGIRLTINWGRGWKGMVHQDWRYSKLEKEHGRSYWLVSFSGVHLFPTICVFLGLIPVYYVFHDPSPFGAIDIFASGITLFAIVIETLADEQLRLFLRSGKSLMTKGLWSWSRHPNYFGEILFWTGLFLFLKEPFNQESYWKAAGVVIMIFLFNIISIPMMEKRQLEKEGYLKYRQMVSRLIPMPPGKKNKT